MYEPLRVSVEFDTGGHPIAGRLTTREGQRPFTGWLGLIAGLENAIGGWQEDDGGADFPGTRRPAPDGRGEEGLV
jgi:hypothetical protein